MNNTMAPCIHKTEECEDDARNNDARRREQMELRVSGQQFRFNKRTTCTACGEKIFTEQTLRKK